MPAVRDTLEYRRVRDLPRRSLSLADAEAWARVFTDRLRLPGSTAEMRPWQAMVLAEALANDGLLGALPVGFGKTLPTYVLSTVLGATRAVLILPANLVEKTYSDFAALAKDWRAPRTPTRMISREELSREQHAGLLDQIRPDLILIDEGDELANSSGAAAARIDRYVVAHPDVRVVVLSGTLTRKSILGYWHLLCWCLRDRAPVPRPFAEASQWAQALDLKSGGAWNGRGMHPGVLGHGGDVDAAREWFFRRLADTPGVMLIDGDSCDAPLRIRTVPARECPKIDAVFECLGLKLETPCGLSVSDPLSRWRFDGQAGCGLYLRWKRQPPDAWRDAYRAKNAFVRSAIEASRRTSKPLDTEMQVLRRYADHSVVRRWRAVKDTFDAETEPVWVSDATIQAAREWLASSPAPGVVWTGCVEFGVALAAALRLPYYGAEGKDQNGRGLHQADPRRSFVASWNANKRGHNLQAWGRALWIQPPQSAKFVEQLVGRHHRAGRSDPVDVTILLTSGGTADALVSAHAEARFAQQTTGIAQKLLRADVALGAPRVTARNRYRWARARGSWQDTQLDA